MASRPPPQEPNQRVRMTCDHCGARLVASVRDAGKRTTCPQCHGVLYIPGEEELGLRDDLAFLKAAVSSPGGKGARTLSKPKPKPLISAPAEAAGQPVRKKRPRRHTQESSILRETHSSRAKLAGWLRRVLVVFLALTIVKIFEAALASILMTSPTNLHGVVANIGQVLNALAGDLGLLIHQRSVFTGPPEPLDRFVLAIVFLTFASRMVVRVKVIDAVYVTSKNWEQRTPAGAVFNFLVMLFQIGILAWAAAAARIPLVGDGLLCGLVAFYLLVSAIHLFMLNLVAGRELRELMGWMLNDALFGLAILLLTLAPGMTQLWTRSGATAVLGMANAVLGWHMGASFIFERRRPGWWWRKPLFLIISCVIVAAVAILLACVR